MESKITCKSISVFFFLKKLQMPELSKVSSQFLIGLKKRSQSIAQNALEMTISWLGHNVYLELARL